MATDDERRELAERLRSANEHSCSPDCELRYALDGSYECTGNGCTGCHRDAFDRLADLIDTDCEEGRYEGVRTARPVDREALLAEAKEAEKSAWYFALDHDENELRDRLAEAAEDFSDMARRIREACGEARDGD